MKAFLPAIGGLLFIGFVTSAFAAPSATNNSPEYRLTVELRDGSRVVGMALDKKIQFHSALLGELKLAVQDIRTVECVSSNTAKLTTAGGDRLTVRFVDSGLPLRTGFGKVELAVDSLRKLTVAITGVAGTRRPGLVACWSGEGDGKDSVGGHDAELTDITFAEGKVGQAFSLDGYSSWANIPADRAIDLAGTDGLTVSAWINPSKVDGFHPILEWEVTRQKNSVQLWLGHLPQDYGVLSGNIGGTDGSSHQLVSSPGTIVAGQFQHVALTYDKAAGISRLFVNGHIVAQESIGSVVPDTSGPIFISRRPCDQPGDWTYNKFFSGLLDEVSVYNRALSPEEICAICTEENHGKPPLAPPPGKIPLPWVNRSSGF